MECELCGREATTRAKIEGTIISVCEQCAAMGERILEAKPVAMREKPKIVIEQSEINPDFARIIRDAREAANLTREQLAEKVKEKLSTIERIEHGSRPTDIVARKLERMLNIKLLGFEEKSFEQKKTKDEPLTLGDVVQIKVRKKRI